MVDHKLDGNLNPSPFEKSKNADLRAEIASLRVENTLLRAEKASLWDEIANLRNQVANLQNENTEFRVAVFLLSLPLQ